jgi:chromate transport protein ChrA
MRRVFHLSAVFSMLGILAFGGGTAVLPQMQEATIHTYHWLTDGQFRASTAWVKSLPDRIP